jgi:hypothetical protein
MTARHRIIALAVSVLTGVFAQGVGINLSGLNPKLVWTVEFRRVPI